MRTEIVLKGKSINPANWTIFKQGLIKYVEETSPMVLTPYQVKFEDQIIDALSYSDSINPLQLYVQAITETEIRSMDEHSTPEPFMTDFKIMFDHGVLEFALYEILHYANLFADEKELIEHKEFYKVLELFKATFQHTKNWSWISECYKVYPAVGQLNDINTGTGPVYQAVGPIDIPFEIPIELTPTKYYLSNGLGLEKGWIYKSNRQHQDLIEITDEFTDGGSEWVRQNQVQEITEKEYNKLAKLLEN